MNLLIVIKIPYSFFILKVNVLSLFDLRCITKKLCQISIAPVKVLLVVDFRLFDRCVTQARILCANGL